MYSIIHNQENKMFTFTKNCGWKLEEPSRMFRRYSECSNIGELSFTSFTFTSMLTVVVLLPPSFASRVSEYDVCCS